MVYTIESSAKIYQYINIRKRTFYESNGAHSEIFDIIKLNRRTSDYACHARIQGAGGQTGFCSTVSQA